MQQTARLSQEIDCPYLVGEFFRQEYFFAYDLNEEEFQGYIDKGWRRFGTFFFRPACRNCRKCIPIRALVDEFIPSKSQKRNLRKNEDTQMVVLPLQFREEIYQLYLAHKEKFPSDDDNEQIDRDHFLRAYYQAAAPCFQTEYYVEGRLAGVGFLDKGTQGLSSIYFAYDPEYSHLGLGTFSALKEMELAGKWKLPYYNLGYYIEQCSRMSYKGRFKPYELMNWDTGDWEKKGVV